MRRLISLPVLLIMVSAPIATFAATSADFLSAHTTAANGNMPYRYFVPPSYDAFESYPLILFLHGAGERGNDNQQQLNNNANGAMRLLGDDNLAVQPVFMVASQCPDKGWWRDAPVLYAISAVDEIAAQCNIDPDRIYITGCRWVAWVHGVP